jgi:hypothetical protein
VATPIFGVLRVIAHQFALIEFARNYARSDFGFSFLVRKRPSDPSLLDLHGEQSQGRSPLTICETQAIVGRQLYLRM